MISGEPRQRAGENDGEETITFRRQKPEKSVLCKSPLFRDKAGRSEKLINCRRQEPVKSTETGTQTR